MGPKKGRRVRKIEVPTDNVSEFADIQWRRQEREAREREEAQQQREEEAGMEEAKTEKKVTLKQRLEERRAIRVTIQEGAHDQHRLLWTF